MYPCEYDIPASGILDNYTGLKNSTCSYCQARCESPDVDASIGFFDGFQTGKSFTFVGIVVGLTVLYQAYNCFWKQKSVDKEWETMRREKDFSRYLENMHD